MKVLIVLLPLLHTISAIPVNSRIIGGSTARVAEFPWQAAIYLYGVDSRQFCSGTLVSHRFVITAAHCAAGGREFTVQLGSNRLQPGDANRVVISTSTKFINPDYDASTLANDLALLEFHMTVTLTAYISPVWLESSEPAIKDGTEVEIAGWGQINDQNAGTVNNLQHVKLVTIPNAECKITYGDAVLDNMVCAVGNLNEGICFGDTGTGLIARPKGVLPVLAGVASFFSGNGCETSDPSGFTRTFPYIDWIKATIAE